MVAKKARSSRKNKRSVLSAEFHENAAKVVGVFFAMSLVASAAAMPLVHDASHSSDATPAPQPADNTGDITILPAESPEQTVLLGEMLDRMGTGETHNKTTQLDIASGGTAGAIGAGVICALQSQEGLMKFAKNNGNSLSKALAAEDSWHNGTLNDESFDTLFDAYDEADSASVGSLIELYALSGNAFDGAGTFPGLGDRFLSKTDIVFNLLKHIDGIKPGKSGMNLSYVRESVTSGDKALNMTKVMERINAKDGPSFFIVATDKETLQPILLDTRGMTAEQILDAAIGGCQMPGITGLEVKGMIDGMYSGGQIPFWRANKADTKILIVNLPVDKTGYEGLDEQGMKQFVLLCSSEEAKNIGNFLELYVKANGAGIRNTKLLQEAQNNTDEYVIFGSPPGDKVVSSSELDPVVLSTATQRSYLYTKGRLLRAAINKGDLIADDKYKEQGFVRLYPPKKLGVPKFFLEIKIDSDGKALDAVIASINPSNSTLKTSYHAAKNFKLPAAKLALLPSSVQAMLDVNLFNKEPVRRGGDLHASYSKQILKTHFRPNFSK